MLTNTTFDFKLMLMNPYCKVCFCCPPLCIC